MPEARAGALEGASTTRRTATSRVAGYSTRCVKTVSYKLDGAGQITDSHDSVDPGTDTHYDYLAGGRLHKQTTTGGGASADGVLLL